MRTYQLLLPVFLFAVSASTLKAATINVPGNEPTIQAGIDACVDGDTVLVAAGTYTGDGNRDIDFMGKAIVVMSENGPEVTIIDCEGSNTEYHRGFYFHNGEDSTSVLKGFTITNGNLSGGGMNIYYSNPTITNCIFSGNLANRGGGIYNDHSSPTITNCMFSGNSTIGSLASGGGMYNRNSSPTVTNCTFSGNSAIGSLSDGGGMFNDGFGFPTIRNCTFSGNWTDGDGGGMGNYQSYPMVTNCTFTGNWAGSEGGGIYSVYSDPTITNCTFSQNDAEYACGGIFFGYGNPTVTNCILWDNGGDEIYGGTPVVTYSDVQGGYTGKGNFDVDPHFISFHGFDYFLHPTSPCVDAGDPSIEDGVSDWHPRWPDWYPNSSRSDMGAYGGPGNVGWLQ